MKYNFVEEDRQKILRERIEVMQADYDELCQKFLNELTRAQNMTPPFQFLPLEYYIKNGQVGKIMEWITLGQMCEDLKLCGLRLQRLKEKLK